MQRPTNFSTEDSARATNKSKPKLMMHTESQLQIHLVYNFRLLLLTENSSRHEMPPADTPPQCYPHVNI